MNTSLPPWKDPSPGPTRPSIVIPWRTIQKLVPHRLRRKLRSKLRSRLSPSSSLSTLQTSFDPSDTLQSLRQHQWSYYDGQYLFLTILGIFSLCIIEHPGPLLKTVVASLLLTSLILPITRQFFLPFLPIATYLIFFYACQFIPKEIRPPISVRLLPTLENIFYGANLSNVLSAHQHVALDLLAWIPYGLGHFGLPAICAIILFLWAPPKYLPVYARTFGYMNMMGVMIQVLFPCSPPWYENMYGLAPANYSMPGSPAGLARIDKLLGIDLYTSTFTASPMVFGAFPSLHSGCATIEAFFMSQAFPKLKPIFIGYVLWIWWATMYLSHHYAVDLVGGSLLAAVFFYVAKTNYLPRIQPEKTWRWDYDYVEIGDAPASDYSYSFAGLDKDQPDSDEWTIGSSSSISSGSLSPVDESQSLWEGETLASHSDIEAAR